MFGFVWLKGREEVEVEKGVFFRHLARPHVKGSLSRQVVDSPCLFGGIQPPVRLALDGHHAVAERRGGQKAVEGAGGGVGDRGGVDGSTCGIRIGPERRECEVVEHSSWL